MKVPFECWHCGYTDGRVSVGGLLTCQNPKCKAQYFYGPYQAEMKRREEEQQRLERERKLEEALAEEMMEQEQTRQLKAQEDRMWQEWVHRQPIQVEMFPLGGEEKANGSK